MTSFLNRRRVLAAGAAAIGGTALGGSLVDSAGATAAPRAKAADVPEETRTLDELYQAALADGGNLVVYAGGDTPTQQDATKAAFRARFPDIKLTLVVDYSKFHNVRVDNQFATQTLVPDVMQLQTLQDFPRWKGQGRLLQYKPAGFSQVYDKFKDADGSWTAISIVAFSFLYDVAAAGTGAPKTPQDLVGTQWKGQIASSYPHDDDAVLYLFKLYAETYGWDWIAQLAAQDIQFGRGTHTPGVAVNTKQKIIGLGAAGTLTAPSTAATKWVAADGHPFMGWGQRAAILKDAKNPTAAKLYLNWQISAARQQAAAWNGWSVRTDVTPPGGLAPIWQYPDAHVDGFPRFMADRAEIERWKQTFALYFGEVKGDPSPGWLGLHPGA
ncbi:ABC transporter substrate-binding protein [Streptomyces sp. NPDC057474]|uniref:ABC transporter substrate-binding protein n=1 Tax=Streptomyces sp. NPDC057474 TaxID=3346144 RepID=UPI0036813044